MSTPSSTRRLTRIGAGVTVLALALTGCEFRGAASLPLPGGQGNGEGAYEVNIEFGDVLDLVPQSAVKVNEVTVGSVTSIDAEDFIAKVVVSLNKDVVLPENSSALVRQTSLLGEKFVSFVPPPANEAVGRLESGDSIPIDRTGRSVDIEEVLSALSLVLNGGSLEQLQVINTEIVAALNGREDKVKDVLGRLNVFVGELDKQKAQIVRALDSLDVLSANLAEQKQTIATALEDIPAGLEVLTDQREDITALLTALDKLGDVSVRLINASKDNTVADLKALTPILDQLNKAGKNFPDALELLTTYPFPRTVSEGIKGDYANLFVTLDLDLRTILGNNGLPTPPSLPVPLPSIPVTLPTAVPSLPGGLPPITVPSVPGGIPVPLPPLPIGGAAKAPAVRPQPAPTPAVNKAPGTLPGISVPGGTSSPLLRLLLGGLS